MKRTWIKLYTEILHDPKMGRLSPREWQIAVQLFLLAAELDQDGLLPPVEDISWNLRINADELLLVLSALSAVKIVHQSEDGWVVTHFKERQYSEGYERVKRYRSKQSNANETDMKRDDNADDAENSSPSSSPSSSDSLSSSDSGRGGVGEKPFPMPETPAQAMKHPDIITFQETCGRIPGDRDYVGVIETIRFLRGKHGDQLADYLKPYWLAWSTRKGKDGKLYKPSSLVWLYEWAMNGSIPTANGHEPKLGESNEDIIRKVAQRAKR
jgi:hypothetical protein